MICWDGAYACIEELLMMDDPGAMCFTAFWASDIMAMILVLKVDSSRSRDISVKSSTAKPCQHADI